MSRTSVFAFVIGAQQPVCLAFVIAQQGTVILLDFRVFFTVYQDLNTGRQHWDILVIELLHQQLATIGILYVRKQRLVSVKYIQNIDIGVAKTLHPARAVAVPNAQFNALDMEPAGEKTFLAFTVLCRGIEARIGNLVVQLAALFSALAAAPQHAVIGNAYRHFLARPVLLAVLARQRQSYAVVLFIKQLRLNAALALLCPGKLDETLHLPVALLKSLMPFR